MVAMVLKFLMLGQPVKIKLVLIQICLLCMMLLPAVVQAQFTFTTNADSTITIWGYTGDSSDVTIPDAIGGVPVTIIGENAFYNSNFKSVIIPNSVSRIEDFAFYACPNLQSISIPSSVASIGFYAFCGCFALTNVNFSNGLTSIGSDAFAYCTNLTSVVIPNGVTDMGLSVFADCYSLTNAIIPSSVTSMGEFAFLRCYNLTSIYFYGNALTYDGQYLFLLDDNLTAYYLPNTIGWEATMDGRPTTPIFLPYPTIYSGQNFGMQTNSFGFTILWATNVPVVVEGSTNLVDWEPVQTNTLTSGSAYFSDSQWTNYPNRFYRLRSP